MLGRKLRALEHPSPDVVDSKDRLSFANTVLWLEDRKIRHYKIEERDDLRNVNDSAVWEKAYEQYRVNVGMPKLDSPLEQLNWLLAYAVRLEYQDDPNKYNSINSVELLNKSSKSVKPSMKADNPFDNMNFYDEDFIAGVRNIAQKLGVANHPNHLVQLEAIERIVQERLGSSSNNREIIEGTPFPFEKGDDIVTEDPALDYPARILRLLQIQSLRQLQTKINETIVAVQELTADPKTDTKLGKVGF